MYIKPEYYSKRLKWRNMLFGYVKIKQPLCMTLILILLKKKTVFVTTRDKKPPFLR